MNVNKQALCGGAAAVDEQELKQINRFSRKELTADEVYTFAVRLCDNQVDRDGERLSRRRWTALRSCSWARRVSLTTTGRPRDRLPAFTGRRWWMSPEW